MTLAWPAEFASALYTSLQDGTFVAATLSGPRPCDLPDAEKASATAVQHKVRPVQLRDRLCYQWTSRVGRQEQHVNSTAAETAERLQALFPAEYGNLVLRTQSSEWQARLSKRDKLLVSRQSVQQSDCSLGHNRRKEHLIPEGTPCPALAAVGIMLPDGRVPARQQHKFRQINRYLEFIRDILPSLPTDRPLTVIDCGCGKSGLTLALWHYLTEVEQRRVQLTGLDLNPAVIATCQQAAASLQTTALHFAVGDISAFAVEGPVDLVISLHACDTATDAALAQAVRWGARVILAVPCCQHELAPQLSANALEPLLRHGILRERLAADATDALRALLLELAGYRTQVQEFIELEHTPKNLLIRAIRRDQPLTDERRHQLTGELTSLQTLLGIREFALDRLLPSTVRSTEVSTAGCPRSGMSANG